MTPELSHPLPPAEEEMDLNDLMMDYRSPDDSEKRRFRSRPGNGNLRPQKQQSEKQASTRRLRQRPAAGHTTSSPQRRASSKSTTRKKALSSLDARSVVSADDWGGGSSNNSSNLSYTDILGQKSLRDVVGGDKLADEVLASHERKLESLVKEQRVKEGRRNNIKNSLASFLRANNAEDEEQDEIQEDPESTAPDLPEVDDDSLISDAEDGDEPLRQSPQERSPLRSAFKRHNSVGKSKSPSVSGRKTRTTRTFDNEGGNPETPTNDGGAGSSNSHHSRKTKSRSRKGVQRIPSKAGTSGDAPKTRSQSSSRSVTTGRRVQRVRRNMLSDSGDDASTSGGAPSRRSHRGSRTPSSVDDCDDRSVSSNRNRSLSRSRVVDSSIRRQRSRSSGIDATRTPSAIRRRSVSRSRGDDDDKSIASKVSHATASKRGRRPGKGPAHTPKNLLPPQTKREAIEDGKQCDGSPPSSVEDNTKDYVSRSMPSLDRHFDSERKEKRKVDLDETSEESSRLSNGTPQSILLQFDPTNVDLIQAVNQSDAKKTSETFRHADGTETNLKISELAGLPTFEKPESSEDLMLGLNGSSQSLDVSVAEKLDEEHMEGLKSKSTTGPGVLTCAVGKPLSSFQKQNPGETPVEALRRPPRATKSTSAATSAGLPSRRGNIQSKSMSFMQRVQNRKAQFHESMMSRSTRVLGLDHQALDDDEGSDQE